MAPKKKTATSTTSLKAISELKTMNKAELTVELQSARKELYVLTMKKELGELKQSHLMRKSRRYVAQISTFLTSTL